MAFKMGPEIFSESSGFSPGTTVVPWPYVVLLQFIFFQSVGFKFKKSLLSIRKLEQELTAGTTAHLPEPFSPNKLEIVVVEFDEFKP
jgi:hypothetical protein